MRRDSLQELLELLEHDSFYYSKNWINTVYRVIKTVADALNLIHKKGHVNLDVKPSNIFLAEKPESPDELSKISFKLGDLGSAVKVGG